MRFRSAPLFVLAWALVAMLTLAVPALADGTVYWTPGGGVYHTHADCISLSRSKTVRSGSIADSGKPRLCKICAGRDGAAEAPASSSGSGVSSSGGSGSASGSSSNASRYSDAELAAIFAIDAGSGAMYRLYNPNSGEHFYTAGIPERNSVVSSGWVYEGVGWYAPSASSTPVYRLYSGTDHHYTTSAAERDHLVSVGWADEGIGWYSDDAQGTPLYRQFNPNVDPHASRNNSGSHNYTTSKEENDHLVGVGWVAEGIGWYGV